MFSEDYGQENFEYIAFLDIDGVFNNQYSKCTYEFLKESVDVINELYDKYKIQLVLSSSWRHAYSFAFMQKLFKENGIKAPLIDRTYICINTEREERISINLEDIYDVESDLDRFNLNTRDNEIFEWVKLFKPKHFVIIDDFKMHGQFLKEHQLLTYNWGNNEEDLSLRLKHIPIIEDILKIENKPY